ncbi:DUF4446 family protein [Paenibacillus allorhizosphaerae]|uniref:DUF4446 family protein n=1 Tax=Paenibacillus allorhizosphaerae TaxID=2849866 RepID=A0ABM8VQG4_9BACL|nr:DUF4446 family protein [Paenibacillus allorhizosphaerae]CAG7654138.1 hypothetical protein PAECIP111802_05691 [Paenibacillus allorhizosphaerae]
MGETITQIPTEVLLLGVGIIFLIFLILLITLWVKLNKLRKSYKMMLNGDRDADIEQILIRMQEKGNTQEDQMAKIEHTLQQMQERMRGMKSNIQILRYNAFAESGSDLSFSIAILDDSQSGVILSGIHNREQTYVYAKPVEQGLSPYALSPEEKEAITRCVLKS